MSNKLEMSLDEISKLGRQNVRRGSVRRRGTNDKKPSGVPRTAPVGVIKKSAKPVKTTVPVIHPKAKEGKVIVSGLVCHSR